MRKGVEHLRIYKVLQGVCISLNYLFFKLLESLKD